MNLCPCHLVPLAETCSCGMKASGKVQQSQRRNTSCTGQELLTVSHYPLSHRVQPCGKRIANPPCHVPCLVVGSVLGKAGCDSRGFCLFDSLIFLNLLTSSQNSVTRLRTSSTWKTLKSLYLTFSFWHQIRMVDIVNLSQFPLCSWQTIFNYSRGVFPLFSPFMGGV